MTVRKIAHWTIGLPIAIFMIGFALANRQWVSLSLNPFNGDPAYAMLTLPIWGLFLFGVFIGWLIGWLVSWIQNAKYRRDARKLHALELEMLRTNSQKNGVRIITEPPPPYAGTGTVPPPP